MSTCPEPKCRRPATSKEGLCGYHQVKQEFGEAWAKLAHPNHPETKRGRTIR